MMWTANEIEDIVMKKPRLAVALLQILVQRTIDFTHRIESFSVDNIARRLARSLIRFSERLGSPEDDGSIRMVPFTHELLSQYVGTSREIVTHYMNQFRRQGYLRYSRKGIILYRDAFKDWLRRRRIGRGLRSAGGLAVGSLFTQAAISRAACAAAQSSRYRGRPLPWRPRSVGGSSPLTRRHCDRLAEFLRA